MVEIVHAGAAEVPVGNRKARGLDDMGRDIQARAQAQNRSGVLGDIGLEERNLHDVGGQSLFRFDRIETGLWIPYFDAFF
jgi:hypothetical protein